MLSGAGAFVERPAIAPGEAEVALQPGSPRDTVVGAPRDAPATPAAPEAARAALEVHVDNADDPEGRDSVAHLRKSFEVLRSREAAALCSESGRLSAILVLRGGAANIEMIEMLPAEPPEPLRLAPDGARDWIADEHVVGRRAVCWECALLLRPLVYSSFLITVNLLQCCFSDAVVIALLALLATVCGAHFCAERRRERASFAVVVEGNAFNITESIEVAEPSGSPLCYPYRLTASELLSLRRVRGASASDCFCCWRNLKLSLGPTVLAPAPSQPSSNCCVTRRPVTMVTLYCIKGADDVARALNAAVGGHALGPPSPHCTDETHTMLSPLWFLSLSISSVGVTGPGGNPRAGTVSVAPARRKSLSSPTL